MRVLNHRLTTSAPKHDRSNRAKTKLKTHQKTYSRKFPAQKEQPPWQIPQNILYANPQPKRDNAG